MARVGIMWHNNWSGERFWICSFSSYGLRASGLVALASGIWMVTYSNNHLQQQDAAIAASASASDLPVLEPLVTTDAIDWGRSVLFGSLATGLLLQHR